MSIELKDIGIKDSAVSSSFIYEPRISRVYANAFQSNARIEHVEIPDADSIDASTFVGCTALRQLVLPGLASFNEIFGNDTDKKALSNLNSVEVRQKAGIADVGIGRVFSGLGGLTELKLPSAVKSIPAKAFSGTGLTSLLFGSSVSLSDNCLSGMPQLQRLQFDISKLPASGNIGLSSCPNLQAIYATASTSTVRQPTFSRTTAEYIQFANQGQSIQYLEESAFADCQHLRTIDFSNASITQVPRCAFKDCSSLSSVYFKSTLTSLAEDSFAGCSIYNAKHGFDLAGIKDLHRVGKFDTFYAYNINHAFDVVWPSAFMNLAVAQGDDAAQATSTSLTAAHINAAAFSGIRSELTSLTLSTLNDSVPTKCFYGSYSLQKVSLNGPNLTAVGDHAFADCYNLTSVSYLDSSKIYYINSYAFANCYQLTSFSFSSGLTAIDGHAYDGCSKLQSIVFSNPSGLSRIGEKAFDNCSLLTSVVFNGMVDPSISSSNIGWTNVTQISFPTLTLEQFGHDYVPTSWFDKAAVNAKYTKLMEVFFAHSAVAHTKLDVVFTFKDVELKHDGIRTDYSCLKYADAAKTQLTAVDISQPDVDQFLLDGLMPSQITSIQAASFSQVRSSFAHLQLLKKLDLNSTSTIGNGALSSMAYLEEVHADKLAAVSQKLFYSDINLKDVSILRAQEIDASAFYDCSMLASAAGSTALTSIGNAAFANCASFRATELKLDNVQSIGVSAFSNCTSLASLQFDNVDHAQLTSIGNYAFSGCTALQKAVLPAKDQTTNVTLLSGVFSKCTSLNDVSLYGKKTIVANVFKDCPATLSIYFRNQDKAKVLSDRSIAIGATTFSSTSFGNPPAGAVVYMSDNNYSHPLLIATTAGQLYSVQNAAFVLSHKGGGKFKLESVDPNYESGTTITYSMLNGIDEIGVEAFKQTRSTQSIQFGFNFGSSAISIPAAAFSLANAGSIHQLHFTGATPTQEAWDSFYNIQLGGNDSIRVFFDDPKTGGYAQGNIISRYADVFEYLINADGIDTIVGVKEDIASKHQIVDTIDSSHKILSTEALTQTQALLQINDFGQICSICDYAFKFNNSISSIVLQTGCSNPTIRPHAFSDSAIRHATIDIAKANGTEQINGYGLNDNVFLDTLQYGDHVTAVAPSAMVNCRSLLSSLHFSTSITSIGQAAFAEFTETFPRLMDVNFNACQNLRTIGDYAFYNSISTLHDSTLSLHSNLTSIGAAAFAYDRASWTQQLRHLTQVGAESIDGGASLKDIGPSAFMYNCLRSVEFPYSLTSIGDCAFAHPKYKFGISIKDNIQHIGKNAFYGNVVLNPNNIKKNIVSIDVSIDQISSIMDTAVNGDYTAENTVGFTDATVVSALGDGDPYKSFVYVLSGLMHFCPQNLSIDLLGRTLINVGKESLTAYVPKYLSCIGPSAFMDCRALTAVSAHEPLSIGECAFMNCSSLKKIYGDVAANSPTFHLDGVVNDRAFFNCSKLSGVLLLSTVTSIGRESFYNCDGISSFFDDATLEMKPYWVLSSIGDGAFKDCSNLQVFDIPSTLVDIGDHVFENAAKLLNINIDLAADDFVQITDSHSIEDAVIQKFGDINDDGSTRINFLDVTYMNNGIVKIDSEFIRTQGYTNADGRSRVALTALNYYDFMDAKQQYLNLSAVSRIDQFVFNGIEKLRSFNVLSCSDPDNPYQLEEIGDYAFNNCTNLMSINGGQLSCSKIGCYAFANCEKLLRLRLAYGSLTPNCIAQGAFFGTSLNTLEIVDCPLDIGEAGYLAWLVETLKAAIGYDQHSNPNPLELPEQCIILLVDSEGTTVGKYDSMMNDLLHASIDINRNALTFVDKTTKSIKPLLLVKPIDGKIPALAANTFHANIVGRWK